MESQFVRDMPAGKYWAGDPQFCFSLAKWRDIVEQMSVSGGPRYMIDNHHVVIFDVRRSGEFDDDEGNSYLVTSDMIAIIPVELIDEGNEPVGINHEFEAKEPFKCYFRMPTVIFGDRSIDIG